MQIGIIAFIVVVLLCSVVLIFADNRQGSRFVQEISTKRNELQQDTFCCMHCGVRKSVSLLSTEMNRMCQECAEMYETVQDEP